MVNSRYQQEMRREARRLIGDVLRQIALINADLDTLTELLGYVNKDFLESYRVQLREAIHDMREAADDVLEG